MVVLRGHFFFESLSKRATALMTASQQVPVLYYDHNLRPRTETQLLDHERETMGGALFANSQLLIGL